MPNYLPPEMSPPWWYRLLPIICNIFNKTTTTFSASTSTTTTTGNNNECSYQFTHASNTPLQTLLWQILTLPCSRPQRQTIFTVSKSPVTIGEWCQCKFFSAMATSRKYCYKFSLQGCKLATELRSSAPHHLWPQQLVLTPALLWRIWCPIVDGSSLPVTHRFIHSLNPNS